MIRLLASCAWICVVTAGAAYVAGSLQRNVPETTDAHKSFESLEHKKTQPINVPMIANGKIEGYVVAQFVYLADAHNLKQMSVPPDVFIADEAFRALYSAPIDFQHLEKYDIGALTSGLVDKVNQRLGVDIVKAVLVEEFIFVPKRDISP